MRGFVDSSLLAVRASSAVATSLLVSLLFCESPARADAASDHLLAQGLFDEGLKLMDAGRFSEACPKLVESQRLDPGGGTLLNIALCHEKEGQLASATLDYENARAQAAKDQRSDRETFARTRMIQIAPRIPHLALSLSKNMPKGAVVLMDQNPVPREAWGVPLPVNSGKHVITVSASNRKPYSSEVELKDGESRALEIPALLPLENEPLGSASGALISPAGSTSDSANGAGGTLMTAPSSGRTIANPLVPALWITAAISFGVSAVSGTWALISWVSYKANCIDGRSFCRTDDGTSAAERARTMALISTVSLAVGAAALLTLPFIPKSRTVVKVGPSQLLLEGTF
jgi:hypothetical protein